MKFFPPSLRYMVSVLVIFLWFLMTSEVLQAQPRDIHIRAVGGLQYDVVRFQATPGERLRIILTNADDMYHNILFTRPGKREMVVEAAFQLAERGPAHQFVPNISEVLWSGNVIGPGESDTILFQVPETQGVYPYVCTYPGHGTVMYGAMYVTYDDLPLIESDPHIPPLRRSANVVDYAHPLHPPSKPKWHPYDLVPPYWYRIFMPHSGPASIAVNLNDSIAYCWDAGACRLRYIWTGDFLDISEPWSIKGDATARILGEVIYTEQAFPLVLEGYSGTVDYKGIRLDDGGYPEFVYSIGGVEVQELIRPLDSQRGISRRFQIGKGPEKVTFLTQFPGSVTFSSDHGKWYGRKLEIQSEGRVEFEIEMIWGAE